MPMIGGKLIKSNSCYAALGAPNDALDAQRLKNVQTEQQAVSRALHHTHLHKQDVKMKISMWSARIRIAIPSKSLLFWAR